MIYFLTTLISLNKLSLIGKFAVLFHLKHFEIILAVDVAKVITRGIRLLLFTLINKNINEIISERKKENIIKLIICTF